MNKKGFFVLSAVLLAVSLVACVSAPPVTLVVTPSENVTLLEGTSVTVGVNAVPNVTTPTVTWVSSDESVATVTSTAANRARVDAIQAGAATITATAPNADALTISVTVTPTPAAVSAEITNAPESLLVGETAAATGVIHTVGGLEDEGAWSTTTPDVIAVNTASGVVTGVAPGAGTLVFTSVTDAELTTSATVTVFATTTDAPAVNTVTSPLGDPATVAFTGEVIRVTTAGVTSSVTFRDANREGIPHDRFNPTLIVPADGSLDVSVDGARLGTIVRVTVGDDMTYAPVISDVTTITVTASDLGPQNANDSDATGFVRVDFVGEATAGAFAIGHYSPADSVTPQVFAIDVTWPETPLFVNEGYTPAVTLTGWRLPTPPAFTLESNSANIVINGSQVFGTTAGAGSIIVTAYGFSETINVLFVNPPADQPPAYITASMVTSEVVRVEWENVGAINLERSANAGVWTQVFTGAASEFTDSTVTAGDTIQYRARTASGTPSAFVTSEPLLVLGAPAPATITDAIITGGALSFAVDASTSVARPITNVAVNVAATFDETIIAYAATGLTHAIPDVIPANFNVTVTVTVTNEVGDTNTDWVFVMPEAAPTVDALVVEHGAGARSAQVAWAPESGWGITLQRRDDLGAFGSTENLASTLGAITFESLTAGTNVTYRARHENSLTLSNVTVINRSNWSTSNTVTIIDTPPEPTNVTAAFAAGDVVVSWLSNATVARPVTSTVVERRGLDGPLGLNVDLSACAAVPVSGSCAVDVTLVSDELVSSVEFTVGNPGSFVVSNVSWSLPGGCSEAWTGTKVAVVCLEGPVDLFRFVRVTFARVGEADELPVLVDAKYFVPGVEPLDPPVEVPVVVNDMSSVVVPWVEVASGELVSFTDASPASRRSFEYRVRQSNAVGDSGWVSSAAVTIP